MPKIMCGIVCCVSLFMFCNTSKNHLPNKCIVNIVNKFNQKVPLQVELALTHEQHSKGLMNRKRLCEDCGMLFVFSHEEYRFFWMKDTIIPLSIAFVDSKGIINDIQHMKPLQTFPYYASKYPAQYAIEVNQNWFNKNHITVGSRVIFDGCLSK